MCCDYKTSDCSPCKPKQKQCYFYVESIENKLKQKEQECEKLKENFNFSMDTLEKVLEHEVELYKKYIDTSFSGIFDWENDKVTIYLEKYIDNLQAENKEFADYAYFKRLQLEVEKAENLKLKQQLDQLKAENGKYKELAKSFEADFFNALSDKESNYVKKLKQALQYIKKVIKKEGYIKKKTQIVKGSILYHALKDLKLPDRKILKIINEVLDV